ncbi:MAG: sporulation protein [Chloroflexi bacterium]|nr:sporulation protein [Chloroflexota bacterium]
MDAHEVLNHARDAMTVKRVFGDPYEKDGITVIPVASVMGGAGAGGGTGVASKPASAGEENGEEGAGDSGYGMGYGLRATPAGVYVIKGGEVEWKPALDTNRLILQRAGVAIVALLVLRSIIRTLARR